MQIIDIIIQEIQEQTGILFQEAHKLNPADTYRYTHSHDDYKNAITTYLGLHNTTLEIAINPPGLHMTKRIIAVIDLTHPQSIQKIINTIKNIPNLTTNDLYNLKCKSSTPSPKK